MRSVKFGAALIALLLFGACAKDQSLHFRNAPVILISIDTLRSDHLPIYDYRNVETPAVDALAKDAIVFAQAWSHCPMTLPSHISMLTGLLPTTHGVRNNLGFRYDASRFESLPLVLQRNGYVTGAAVSSYVLRGETGLRDAFQWYDDALDPSPGARFTEYQRSGAVSARLGEKWIATLGDRPFFFFLHLYEPHAPYDPPEPFRSRFASRYDGEIATADAIVGRFLQELKRRRIYDKAIIILTSDHGEGLGDHGEQQHSVLLYTEALRVPLVIKLPHGVRGGTRVKTPAALVDLAPTAESLVGIKVAPSDGVNLFAETLPAREIYSETIYPYVQLGWSDLRSLVNDQYHYIHSPRPELYEIKRDAEEKHDIVAERRREAARLRAEIEKFPPATISTAQVDAETAAKLAALGYVGSVRARPDPRALPNPVDHIGTIEEIAKAFQLASEQRYGEAISRMRSLLEKDPRLVDVWVRLAEVYAELGRLDDAIDAYKKAIGSAGVFSSEIVASLGGVYLDAGRIADAESAARAAISASPDKARALEVRVALARHDLDDAERIASSLANRPNSTAGDLLLLAEVKRGRGDLRGALALVEKSSARAAAVGESGVYGLDALRAEILIQMDRHEEAIRAYESELAHFPHNGRAYSRLAVLYFVMGNRAAVDRTLERLVAANPAPGAYELAARTLEAVEDVHGAQAWRARAPK